MALLKTYTGVGLMSGSSLDGLDMALCRFVLSPETGAVEEWQILQAATESYTDAWMERLAGLAGASALDLARTHVALGHLWANMLQGFLNAAEVVPDYIASHGHTVFHYPE
ncbi:MAG: anhydro-N-acetylmuramic acid kinase, partial [Phaeodactylibacter sp.]|nr:anhydro-N-acetylmuramic acid kinase [Phaeodactylibacter sp.]